MKFHELTPEIQQRIINRVQQDGLSYPDYEWWDSIYEWFTEFCDELGVDVSFTEQTIKSRNGKLRYLKRHNIEFDLHNSEAKFNGTYCPIRTVMPEISDERVAKAYKELRSFELSRFLQRLPPFVSSIEKSTVSSVDEYSYDETDFNSGESEIFEELLQAVVDELSNMLYRNLQSEYDWFGSEEFIREELMNSEEEYDENKAAII